MPSEKPEPLTAVQKEQLEAELAELEGPRRVAIVEAIKTARGFGDLSENFEYHAAKNEQGLLERRIRVLRDRLSRAVLVDEDAAAEGTVGVGSKVELEDEQGGRLQVEISSVGGVSPDSPVGRALLGSKAGDEVEISSVGGVSPDSPVGRALLGAKAGDEVEIEAPSGSWRARVISVGR